MDQAADRPLFQGERALRHSHRRFALCCHIRGFPRQSLQRGGKQRAALGDPLLHGCQPRQVCLHQRTEQAQQRRCRRLHGEHGGRGEELSQKPHQRNGGHDYQRREGRTTAARRKLRLGRRVEPPLRGAQRQRLNRRPDIRSRPRRQLQLHPCLPSRLHQREPTAL